MSEARKRDGPAKEAARDENECKESGSISLVLHELVKTVSSDSHDRYLLKMALFNCCTAQASE